MIKNIFNINNLITSKLPYFFQDSASPIMEGIINLHNYIFYLIVILIFVLFMIYSIYDIAIWTLIPSIILDFIISTICIIILFVKYSFLFKYNINN
jgi:hypothetical protein